MTLNRLLCSSALSGLALMSAAPAFAQVAGDGDATPPPIPGPTAEQCANDPSTLGCDLTEVPTSGTSPDASDSSAGGVVITGSRIARPNLESSSPIVAVDADELLNGGNLSIGDALNELPSLRSTFSTANSQRFIGTAGLGFLDLRGLGTSRTLVLVNSRRHVGSSAGDFQVDVNTIPTELLERVEVRTGGSSAVYGSDAIAGVVNFILKRDYDGTRLTVGTSIADKGDFAQPYVSGTIGRNFADGRGNIAFAAEYSSSDAVFNSQRPGQSGAFDGITAFVQTGDGTGPDDPTLTLQNRLRYNFLSDGGTFSGNCVVDTPVDQPFGCDANGQNAVYRFLPNGRLARENGITTDFRPTDGTFVQGGLGSTLSNTDTLFPAVERYSFNFLGHYDISDALKPFIELKYARINVQAETSPSFSNGFCNGLTGASGLNGSCNVNSSSNTFVSFDNPFLNPADVATIRGVQNELLGLFGVGPASTGFFINRNNVDFGTRSEDLKRETYRVVGGIEGSFNDDWRYELSGTYGRFESDRRSGNNLIVQNFKNAVDAVSVGGNIVCRINADASTANDDPNCVPINIFGFGAPSQAALNYVNTTGTFTEKATQFDALAFVNGDSSQIFELPGGPLRFVLGGEFRRETSSAVSDEITASGATFLNASPPFNPPAFEVKEVFGELELPILANQRFAEELTLAAAGRISDYNRGAGATGTTYTYNVSGIYSPISDLRLRVNYSRAVRSPTPSDLFTDQFQNFAFLSDPCDRRNINDGTPARIANCRANNPIANVPVDYQQAPGNRSVLQGGNPNLEAETSKSLTAGFIFQPRFLPGFTATVDYYDIEVNQLIASLGGNTILTNCFDDPNGLDNQFCRLINPRQADGSFDPQAALLISTVNFAKLTAKGIDADIRYSKRFDNGDFLSLRGITTYNIERNNFLDPDNPTVPNRVLGELGDPEWAANFSASYRRDVIQLRYDLRFVDRQVIGAYENYFAFDGDGPDNPFFTNERVYPRRFYHDVRVDFRVNEDFSFFGGISNFTNQLPPFGLTGLGGGSGIYDPLGRLFFFGARANF